MSHRLLEQSITIQAPAAKVWQVFVDPTVTRQMGGEYVTTWEAGAPFGWQNLDGQPLTHGAILEIDPGCSFRHSLYHAEPAPGQTAPAVQSLITYTLREEQGRTILAATEEFTEPPSAEDYEGAVEGWQAALQSVKAIAEQ